METLESFASVVLSHMGSIQYKLLTVGHDKIGHELNNEMQHGTDYVRVGHDKIGHD